MSEYSNATFGQKAVGLKFNPSNDDAIAETKQLFADLIDRANNGRKNANGPGQARHYSIVITMLEDAQMRFIKAQTWSKDQDAILDDNLPDG